MAKLDSTEPALPVLAWSVLCPKNGRENIKLSKQFCIKLSKLSKQKSCFVLHVHEGPSFKYDADDDGYSSVPDALQLYPM